MLQNIIGGRVNSNNHQVIVSNNINTNGNQGNNHIVVNNNNLINSNINNNNNNLNDHVPFAHAQTLSAPKTNNDRMESFLKILQERQPILRNPQDASTIQLHLFTVNEFNTGVTAGTSSNSSVLDRQIKYIDSIVDTDIKREVLKIFIKDMVEKSGFLTGKSLTPKDVESIQALIQTINQITAKIGNTPKQEQTNQVLSQPINTFKNAINPTLNLLNSFSNGQKQTQWKQNHGHTHANAPMPSTNTDFRGNQFAPGNLAQVDIYGGVHFPPFSANQNNVRTPQRMPIAALMEKAINGHEVHVAPIQEQQQTHVHQDIYGGVINHSHDHGTERHTHKLQANPVVHVNVPETFQHQHLPIDQNSAHVTNHHAPSPAGIGHQHDQNPVNHLDTHVHNDIPQAALLETAGNGNHVAAANEPAVVHEHQDIFGGVQLHSHAEATLKHGHSHATNAQFSLDQNNSDMRAPAVVSDIDALIRDALSQGSGVDPTPGDQGTALGM